MKTPPCKRYTGYRPCFPYKVCDRETLSEDCIPFTSQRLIVDLSPDAALLRDAAIMSTVQKNYNKTQMAAVVHPECVDVYRENSYTDLVFPFDFESVSILNLMRFDETLALEEDTEGLALINALKETPAKRAFLKEGALCGQPSVNPAPKKEIKRILIINLDALGDVLMTTALLPVLKRRWPEALIDWVTVPYAVNVLKHNPMIERIIPYTEESVADLPARTEYDLLISVDKGRRSCALAELVPCADKRGYGMNEKGHITYFNPEAAYAYRLGIDDHEKFRVNKKTGQQLLAESIGLNWERDLYTLVLTKEEKEFVAEYRKSHGVTPDRPAVGFNTGCSDLYPHKKMTIEQHVELIKKITQKIPKAVILLVGGKQETERNAEIVRLCKEAGVTAPVITTPTTEGLRKGILYIEACDALVTGDTSALHIGVALGKFVLSWYGLSCWEEIDLYENGVKFYHEDLECSPCWKKKCDNLSHGGHMPECLTRLDLEAMAESLKEWAAERSVQE